MNLMILNDDYKKDEIRGGQVCFGLLIFLFFYSDQIPRAAHSYQVQADRIAFLHNQ